MARGLEPKPGHHQRNIGGHMSLTKRQIVRSTVTKHSGFHHSVTCPRGPHASRSERRKTNPIASRSDSTNIGNRPQYDKCGRSVKLRRRRSTDAEPSSYENPNSVAPLGVLNLSRRASQAPTSSNIQPTAQGGQALRIEVFRVLSRRASFLAQSDSALLAPSAFA